MDIMSLIKLAGILAVADSRCPRAISNSEQHVKNEDGYELGANTCLYAVEETAITPILAMISCASMQFHESHQARAWLVDQFEPWYMTSGSYGVVKLMNDLLPDAQRIVPGVVRSQTSSDQFWTLSQRILMKEEFLPPCDEESLDDSSTCIAIIRPDTSNTSSLCYEATECHRRDSYRFICAANALESPPVEKVCENHKLSYQLCNQLFCYDTMQPVPTNNISFVDAIDPEDDYRMPFTPAALREMVLLLTEFYNRTLLPKDGPVLTSLTTRFDTYCKHEWLPGPDAFRFDALKAALTIGKHGVGTCNGILFNRNENDTHIELSLILQPYDCYERQPALQRVYMYYNCSFFDGRKAKHDFIQSISNTESHCMSPKQKQPSTQQKQPLQSAVVGATVFSVVFIFIVVICFSILIHKRCRRSKVTDSSTVDVEEDACRIHNDSSIRANATSLDGMLADLMERDLCIEKEDLILVRRLGSGEFGDVWSATHKGCDVAAKTIDAIDEGDAVVSRTEVLLEAFVMSRFHHPNIVAFYGLAMESDTRPSALAMELLPGGDLKTYLQHSDDSRDIICAIIHDVLAGLVYLAEARFIHRDIAARNILLTPTQHMRAKIADFGMTRRTSETRRYYRMESHGRIPIKWVAREVLQDWLTWTCLADVWSLGILIWEVITCGGTPYGGMSPTDVVNVVTSGGHPDRPDDCTDEWWAIMQLCWSNHEHRPSAGQLLNSVDELRRNESEMNDDDPLAVSNTGYFEMKKLEGYFEMDELPSTSGFQTAATCR